MALRLLLALAVLAAAPLRAQAPAEARTAPFEGHQAPNAPFEGRYAFRVYGDEDGLANTTVECLLQDRQGFLWVGTQDGLFRFDGRRFLRFGRGEGLPSSRINSLHETASGRLYAGTRGGLAVLEPEAVPRFRPLGPAEGLPETAIPDQGIASGSAGGIDALYVGTPEGLFVAEGGGRFRRELPPQSPAPGVPVAGAAEITGLHVAPDGALVFASGRRLFRRAGGRITAVAGVPDLSADLPLDERIDQTLTDGAGRLWLRTLTSLWVAAPGPSGAPRRFVRDDAGLPAGVASGRLVLDDRGRLLVPTARGLAWRGPGGWRLLGRREGLAGETVLAALVDREGSLWIGVAGAGLAQQLGRGAFRSWSSAEGLSHDVVWAIARQRAPGGRPESARPLWIGTEDGLNRLDPASGRIRVWRTADGLSGNTVYALAAADDGTVWAGTWPGGVTRIAAGSAGEPALRRFGARDLPDRDFKVIALHLERDGPGRGTLWAGAASGVYRLAPGAAAFEPVRLPGGGERDSVYGFARDRRGDLWAAGRHGLQRLTGEHPRRFQKADGLLADFLSSIVAGSAGEGDLVAGYREALGAARITVQGDRLRLRPLSAATGLSFDKVLFLGRDTAGALWVGGGAGVDVLRPGRPPLHFGTASGLATEDMSQNAFLAEADGTVWLGTSRGLVRHRPQPGRVRRLPLPILLTEVTAGSRRLAPAGANDPPAELGREERALRVAWAAPTFLDPRRLRFRYRLAGLEEELVETSAHEVRFPPLPAGSYRLEVVAVAPDPAGGERVSPRPAALAFTVLPAWWERWWARGGAAVLVALLGLAAVRLRTRALEADRRRLERAVAERSAELARAVRDLEEASFTDPLTGVRNRRFLTATAGEDVRRALAGEADLVVYLLDLDHFKSVNDRYGHQAGDRLLVEVAARLAREVRAGDLLVRWGGEEFLVLARHPRDGAGSPDAEQAGRLAERLLAAVRDEPFPLGEPGAAGDDAAPVARTCSIGWAPFPWLPEEPGALPFEQVLALADAALYAAKRDGRDRAVGVLPLAGAARPAGWWQRPPAEGEGQWLRLVRSDGTGGSGGGSGAAAAGGPAVGHAISFRP